MTTRSPWGAPRGPQPDPLDFCNAFWGDRGIHALLGRVKASSRMLDDLRTWYKERAAAEEDYAKRLQRLAKAPFLQGGYEVGAVKHALDAIRKATAQTGHSHAELAGTFKTTMERKTAEFIARRDEARKTPQGLVERVYKKRVDLAECLEKARRKFEADAIAINGLQAQMHLVEGRDADKVSTKLDKTRLSIQITEKEYRTHLSNSEATHEDWKSQWKAFADLSQDLEEERLDLVHTLFWDYANAVSTICVVVDEQSEKMRVALERCDTKKDIRTFVKHAATGPDIESTPKFIDYPNGAQTPLAWPISQASFVRSSLRDPEHPSIEGTPLQDLVATLGSRPPTPPPVVPITPVQTAHESRAKVRKGGAIAEMVAANSLAQAGRSSVAGSPTPSRPLSTISLNQRDSQQMAFDVQDWAGSVARSQSRASDDSTRLLPPSRPDSPTKPLPIIPKLPSLFRRVPVPQVSPQDVQAAQQEQEWSGSQASWVPGDG